MNRLWGRAMPCRRLSAGALLFFVAMTLQAETGRQAWLRYSKTTATVPAVLATLDTSAIIDTARDEILKGIRGMTGKTLRLESVMPKEPAIILRIGAGSAPDAYSIKTVDGNIIIAASTTIRWVNQWDRLDGSIERGYGGKSIFWENGRAPRDLLRASQIPDEKHRVGNYPGRTEAESIALEGYSIVDVKPWETASGGKAVECPIARCTASFRYDGPPGWHELHVQYFDQSTGISSFRLFVNAQQIDQWQAADQVPERLTKIDSSSSTRRTITGIALRKGDEIRIEGVPDGPERAALDYVEIK